MAWLHTNAGANGTPPRVFVGGHSAGGHYAALLAVMHAWRAKHDLPADVIRGCLPISGVFQLSARPQGPEAPVSPVWAIEGDPPPFLITVGEHDPPNIIHNGQTMATALKDAGGTVETLVLKDCDHLATSVISGEADGPWAPRAHSFMAAH
jgi:arylformamidase